MTPAELFQAAARRAPGSTRVAEPAAHRTVRPRRWIVPTGLLLAVAVAGCSNAGAYGGYGGTAGGAGASAAVPSPAASGSMAMPSMPSGSPAGTGSPSIAPSPSAPVAAGVTIAAKNIAFDRDHLDAPAGTPFVLRFDNNDPGVPHNVEILDASGASVFKGEIVTGPTSVAYQVPALKAGSYTFTCDVHPNMKGTLTAA